MSKKIKEIRLVNSGFQYILTEADCDMSLIYTKQWFCHPDSMVNPDKTPHTIMYELIITPKIDKSKIKGEFFSKDWQDSFNEYKNNSDEYKRTLTLLEDSFFKRITDLDEIIEFMDEEGNIYNEKINPYSQHSFINFSAQSNNDIKPVDSWMRINDIISPYFDPYREVFKLEIKEIKSNEINTVFDIFSKNQIIGRLIYNQNNFVLNGEKTKDIHKIIRLVLEQARNING